MRKTNEEVQNYFQQVDTKWQTALLTLQKIADDNIPVDFALEMQYGMPTYVVPLATYPDGYLNRKNEPLPFISIAAQKNFIAVYHLGLIADQQLTTWFEENYPKYMTTKLNMGKSCIRFTNPEKIPYDLLAQLFQKMSIDTWIKLYETSQNNKTSHK